MDVGEGVRGGLTWAGAGPTRATRLIFSSVIRITGIALGWIGAIMVGLGRQGVERLMLALDGRALWAAGATQAYPGAYEAEERSIIA